MIKKGLKVKILTGKDKKKEGEVIEIDRSNNRAKIKGLNLIKKHKVNFDNKFSILVNNGPGSFSAVRVSLAVAKGIKISHI